MASSIPSTTTLRDVAAATGVSVSTVSRALAGKAEAYRISQPTVDLICRRANELGFVPSQVARSLRLKKTGLIGVLVPDISNAFFSAIAHEITRAASDNGLSVVLSDSCDSVVREKTLLKQLQGRQVEGIIICPIGIEFSHLQGIHQTQLPIIVVDRIQQRVSRSDIISVTTDHRTATNELISRLVSHGHRRIGVLQGLPGTAPCRERIAGYREALRKYRIPFDPHLIAGDQFTIASGRNACEQLLDTFLDLTAVFAMSNQNALGALQAIRCRGLSVPKDISLVAFDDHPFIEFLETPLTTATQDVKELGQVAAKLLIDQIHSGKRLPKTLHRIPAKVVERHSIATVH